MANRSTPSRSFNTLRHSNREDRIKRDRQGRIALLAMTVIAIAIVLTLAIFLICSAVDHFGSIAPPTPDDNDTSTENNGAVGGEITYASITKASSDIHAGVLLIVNKSTEYVFPSSTSNLVVIDSNRLKYEGIYNTYLPTGYNWKLDKTALDAFNQMMYKFYELEGDGSVKISSAYRSYEDQANSSTSSTPAGFSDHHTGYCLSLRTGSGGYLDVDAHWIYLNSHKYGYVVRYPDDKSDITGVSGYEYCFRYVGVPHATYMSANDLCLEEYVSLLATDYAGEEHLQIKGADGNDYEVYYVAAAATDLTTIKVPSNYEYTLSGDNMGGFIVTVNLDAPRASAE